MVDRYTKIMLTLIAACLVVIAGRGLVPAASAQAGPVHVIVDSVAQFAFQFATVPVRVQQ